jgi:iron complex outermembrane receptor protein
VRPAYTLVNCSVEWWSQSTSPIGVRLWGRNLSNAYYPGNLISSSGGWYGTYSPPRTYGLTLLKDF